MVIEGMISWGAATPTVGSIKLLGLEDEGETLQFPATKQEGQIQNECAIMWPLGLGVLIMEKLKYLLSST